MSATRSADQKELSALNTNNVSLQEFIKGSFVGLISSTAMFPIDKITFIFQTKKGVGHLSVLDAAKMALKRPNTFNGYVPGLISTIAKNGLVFGIKGEVAKHVDKRFAGFVAGLMGVYLTSPLAVIKALAYNNMPVSVAIKTLKLSDYLRGVHAKALCDSFQFGVYFAMLPLVSQYIDNSFVAGSVAGFSGGFFSNPPAMVAMGQKINGTSALEEMTSLYKDGGFPRFYRGYLRTTAGRMTVQGALVGTAIELFDRMSHGYGSKNSNE